MRDFLTGLAVILIVVLTTALVAPYFIDWNGQRAFVEARLSHALGQKVTVGGAIDLKLLPTPYIVLDQTVIGSDDGPIRMGIHHLDLQLSVAPLMHGEFEVVDARLEEPTIRIRLEPDRTLPAIPDAPALRADVRFDRVTVVGGTLAIADPQSGHTFVLDNLDLDADAPSLAGPFKAKGAAGDQASRTTFRLSTTAAQHGRARTHLIVGETATHAGLDLDGTLALTSAGRETVRQSFDGTLALFGHVDDVAHAPVAWKLSGPLKADPAKATLAGGELRLGTEAAGLILAATGDADLGTTPSLHLDLTAKQLDIDRLAGAPVDQVAPPPPELPDLASLRRALAAATPPVPTVLDVSVDTATWGGETLSDLAAHVGLGGSGPQRLQIGGNGPGHTHVGADGLLSPAPAPSFNGAVELSTVDLPHALRWLSLVDPDVALKPEDVPFKPVKLTAKVKADGTAIEATGLALNLGRSTLSGTAHLALDAPRAKLTAVLQAEALDLDTLPDLAAAHGKTGAFDLDLKLAANAFKLSHAGEGALDAGHLDLALSTNGRHVDLTTFRAQNLGGASVAATGHLDADGATLNATIDAAKLDAFAALVRQVAPSPWTDALVARAPTLSPAKLSIDATLTPTGTETTGALHPSRMQVDGTLGATSLNMRVDPPIEGKQIVSLTGSLRSSDGGALLRQLGAPALPVSVVGKSSLTVAASGPAGQPLDTTVHATFGTTQATIAGRFTLFDTVRHGSGTLDVRSSDLSPLLQSVALATPDRSTAIPAAFTTALSLGDDGATFAGLKGRLGTVAMSGSVRFNPANDDRPSLTGTLDLDHIAMSDLVALAFGPPQGTAAGMAWSSLRFGAVLFDPPRTGLALKIATLDLAPRLDRHRRDRRSRPRAQPGDAETRAWIACRRHAVLRRHAATRRSVGRAGGPHRHRQGGCRPPRPAHARERNARCGRQRRVGAGRRLEPRRHRVGDLGRRDDPRRRGRGAAQGLRRRRKRHGGRRPGDDRAQFFRRRAAVRSTSARDPSASRSPAARSSSTSRITPKGTARHSRARSRPSSTCASPVSSRRSAKRCTPCRRTGPDLRHPSSSASTGRRPRRNAPSTSAPSLIPSPRVRLPAKPPASKPTSSMSASVPSSTNACSPNAGASRIG